MLLSEREAQINHEKIAVYKQRQELEMFKSNISCAKCKEPVKDFGMMGLSMPSNFIIDNKPLEHLHLVKSIQYKIYQLLISREYCNLFRYS